MTELVYCSANLFYHLLPDRKYFNICQVLGKMIHSGPCIPIDRTETFNIGFNVKSLYEIPELPHSFNKSFSDICLERAQNIVSLNKPITVLWSGGIDSTCVLVSLLMTINDTSRIKVVFEPRSINEYPWFFEKFIKNKLSFKVLDEYIGKYKPSLNEIVVSGADADWIFGSPVCMVDNFEYRNDPWQNAFNTDKLHIDDKLRVLKKIFYSSENKKFVCDLLPVQLKKSPIEIKTIADLYWWLEFSIGWQPMTFRTCGHSFTYPEYYFSNIYCFFNTVDFQKWSLYNHDKKEIKKPESFKQVVKDFIYEYTKDSDYRDNKMKEPSGQHILSLDNSINTTSKWSEYQNDPNMKFAIDTDFNNYTLNEIRSNKVLLDSILSSDFKWLLINQSPPSSQWKEY